MINKPLCIEIDDFVVLCIRVFVCNGIKWIISLCVSPVTVKRRCPEIM